MPTAICSNCSRPVAYSEEAENVFCVWCGASITPRQDLTDVAPSNSDGAHARYRRKKTIPAGRIVLLTVSVVAVLIGFLIYVAARNKGAANKQQVGSANGESSNQFTKGKVADVARLPQTLTIRYNGRDAESWGRSLLDINDPESSSGGEALSQIGKEGLRFFARGLQHENAVVLRNSLYWFNNNYNVNGGGVRGYEDVFIPLLIPLLKHQDAEVRRLATQWLIQWRAAFKEGFSGLSKEELSILKDAQDSHNAYEKELRRQEKYFREKGRKE
jgi:hypothetical protein